MVRRTMLGQRQQPAPYEIPIMAIVEEGGGRYVGLQRGFGIQPTLVLFLDTHGSTRALPLLTLSASAVRAHIQECEGRWQCKNNSAGGGLSSVTTDSI
jgi:hypothetical protein